uniref:Orphan peptide AbOp-14 n=1 Tax=Androctonus bicolor TaxID=748906 RepID=A0A0K0LC23_9SCOR|nr:orphan peptide AbOp-14 [Androctonus bicolor]
MKPRTFLVLFLVCILVMDAVVARRCGGNRRRKVLKMVRKLRPLVKVIRIIKKIRSRAPCSDSRLT